MSCSSANTCAFSTLLAATAVIFVILQIVPGDPAAYMMGMNASPESIASLRAQMGLDGAPLERYLSWLGGLATGQLGTSYTYLVPVGDLIVEGTGAVEAVEDRLAHPLGGRSNITARRSNDSAAAGRTGDDSHAVTLPGLSSP